MGAEDWEAFHRRWQHLTPPLRPDADVVAAVAGIVAGTDQHVLLLGATPELAGIGDRLVAIDWCEKAAARIWPGDDGRRRIVRADWRAMPFADVSFTAVIGDGSLAVRSIAEYEPLLDGIARVLRPGGRVAIRCYLAPERGETLAEVATEAMAGRGGGFDAIKWRIAMALADDQADVMMATILEAFDHLFPDRTALAAATGWRQDKIATIDAYAGSRAVLSFPTEAALRANIPESFAARLVPAGGYPLADRCPILVLERR